MIGFNNDRLQATVVAPLCILLALGIVVRTFRNRATANVDEVNLLKW